MRRKAVKKKLQLPAAGFEPATFGFWTLHSNHSAKGATRAMAISFWPFVLCLRTSYTPAVSFPAFSGLGKRKYVQRACRKCRCTCTACTDISTCLTIPILAVDLPCLAQLHTLCQRVHWRQSLIAVFLCTAEHWRNPHFWSSMIATSQSHKDCPGSWMGRWWWSVICVVLVLLRHSGYIVQLTLYQPAKRSRNHVLKYNA